MFFQPNIRLMTAIAIGLQSTDVESFRTNVEFFKRILDIFQPNIRSRMRAISNKISIGPATKNIDSGSGGESIAPTQNPANQKCRLNWVNVSL